MWVWECAPEKPDSIDIPYVEDRYKATESIHWLLASMPVLLWYTFLMNAEKIANSIIRAGFMVLFVLVPLVLTPWNYELFEYNKMMLTYATASVILAAWAIKMVARRELFVSRTPLDVPLMLFVGSQLVSSVISIDPHVSWFGYYSRFNGGMFSVLTYISLYYAFASNIARPDEKTNTASYIRTLVYGAMSSALLVSVYGIAEHYGIDKHIWVQDVQNRVFSTLGQPNWLAAYLIALLPLSVILSAYVPNHHFRNAKRTGISIQEMLALGLSVVYFITLLYTRSRSGLLGFAIADAALLAFTFFSKIDRKAALIRLGIVHVMFATTVFINGTHIDQIDRFITLNGLRQTFTHSAVTTPTPTAETTQAQGPALETGGTESGTIRKYVWEAAITAWRATPKNFLIGTGTETFAFTFYQYKPLGHNLTSEWDFLYNKAHNEYLNYLATTGIFGLGSYLLFIGSFIVWYLVRRIRLTREGKHPVLADALFAGWMSILVTNFFGFSVVIMQILLFLIPVIVLGIVLSEQDTPETPPLLVRTLRLAIPEPILYLVIACLAGGTVVTIAYTWLADYTFTAGYRLEKSGQYAQAYPYISQAISMNSGEPMYHDERASLLTSLAQLSLQDKQSTLGAELMRQSMAENDIAISISPNNINYWKTRTKIFYAFAGYDAAFLPAAIEALMRAKSLSPNDPKITYNLAILHARAGNSDKAYSFLEETRRLKPNYRDAYYAEYLLRKDAKETDKANSILDQYLKSVDANDTEFKNILSGKEP